VKASANVLVPFQLRTIRVGTQTTLGALLATAAFVGFSSDGQVKVGPYFALFISVTIAAAIVTLLPGKRLFEGSLGSGIGYAWTGANIILITLGIWVTGEHESFLFLLYGLPTVFSAVSFRPRVQVAFLAFTFLCYSTVIEVMGWDIISLAVLATLAFLASFLSRELKRQMALHSQARRQSERRWDLVAAVAAAARNMSGADSRGVLQTVVDSVGALGFETACIYVHEGPDAPYRAIFPVGLSGDLPRTPYSLPPAVLTSIEQGRTVVVRGDPAEGAGDWWLGTVGLQGAVAIPVPVAGGAQAVLFVGSRQPRGPSPEDIEVLRMLAAQASLALENARRFEEQRLDMEHLREVDRLKGDFLSTVSHELRTPLTVISGMGLTLERQWQDMDDQLRSELLSRLNANAASLNDIITKLLDFARAEAGYLEASTQEVDVLALVEGVVDRLHTLLLNHALDLRVEDGLSVEADPVLLERIIENLLSNAAKYTPEGSRIEVSARAEGREAVVQVSDDGPGIPPDELEHLGERFFRGGDPNTRGTRGTGLGLALVREILALHDGRLEVDSVVGVGSRFRFRLPLASAGAAGVSSAPAVVGEAGSGLRSIAMPNRFGSFPRERFETVVTAARLGAEWAVAALHDDLNPRIESYLRVQAPGAVEELTRDVWMEVASGLGGFEGDEASFRRWVFTVARQRLQELRHSRGGLTTVLSIDGPGEDREIDATADALLRIAALPPDEAEVVLLRVVGDLSAEEVAAVTGRRTAAVRALQVQGLGRLFDDVEDRLVVPTEVGGLHAS
jgi:RNA polymerase sigma factor (sigma-70 family)